MTPTGWRFYPLWVAVGVGLAAAIVFLSLAPPSAVPTPFAVQDKLGHLIAYATLAGWNVQLVATRRHGTLALACIGLGIGLELVQGVTAQRTLDGMDALANTLGVTVGAGASRYWMRGWLAALDAWAGSR